MGLFTMLEKLFVAVMNFLISEPLIVRHFKKESRRNSIKSHMFSRVPHEQI